MIDEETTNASVKDWANFSDNFSALAHDSTHVQVMAAANPNSG